MMRRFVLAAAIVTLAATSQAQPMPPGKWWRRPEIVKNLQLSRDQQTRLDEIFRTAANDLIDAKSEAEKMQVALRGELDRPQLRRAELMKIAAQLSAARAKLFERELMMLADMRGVLDDEQWARVREVLDREERRGPPGGGPPGGGPRPRP